MVDDIEKTSEGRKLALTIIVVLVVFGLLGATTIAISSGWIDIPEWMNTFNNDQDASPPITNVTAVRAKELIDTSSSLTVVDIRGCKCKYDKEHIPGSIWKKNANYFFNTTEDLLIYDLDGSGSYTYCQELVNNTYGAIYNLADGIESWKTAGYAVEAVETVE